MFPLELIWPDAVMFVVLTYPVLIIFPLDDISPPNMSKWTTDADCTPIIVLALTILAVTLVCVEINPLALVAWLALFSGPILICLSSVLDGNTVKYITEASFDHWIIAIYIGFIMQPITYGCFYYVLKNNPLYKVLPIVTMGIPPTGLLAAIFLLGEKPTDELFIGGTIIIIAIVFYGFNARKYRFRY